jgi:hypothetical protein
MKEFDFSSRTKFKIKGRGGEEYICEVPPQIYMIDWGKRMASLDIESKDGAYTQELESLTNELFVKLGCPDGFYKELESDHVEKLINFLGAKKN